jgi:hypothetical protein
MYLAENSILIKEPLNISNVNCYKNVINFPVHHLNIDKHEEV